MPNRSSDTRKHTDAQPHKLGKKPSAQSGKNMGKRTEHSHMISDAAPLPALKRGFDGGNSVDDWLTAEEEVDCMLYGKKKSDRQSGCE
jgi:hypothetical protein